MNTQDSAFGLLFKDLLQNLTDMFPECQATKTLLSQLSPVTIELIKQDWYQQITPYTLKGFKYPGHYFERIRKEISPTHVFNTLGLLEKFKVLDADSQTELCSLLSDLEMFACEKAQSDEKDMKTPTNIRGKSRFDDPALHKMCVKILGDEKLANELRTVCSQEPLLNEMYQNKTNEQIAQQMKETKPLLPIFIKLAKSKSLPMNLIVKFMQRKTPSKGVTPKAK